MSNRSRFENNLMECIWNEVADSDLIQDAISANKDSLKDIVKDCVDDMDLADYIDVDDEVETAVEDVIAKTIEEKVNIQSILNIISETPEFKKLIQDKVLEEFNKLWIA